MNEEARDRAMVETTPAALELSEQAIATVKHNIQLCEQLVKEVLEKEIDWGTIPGVQQPFLWDSGAAKIMSAFNCYPEYKVIDATIRTPHIRYTITSQLINRQSQQVIATGIGAASTKEVKHRYRWVEDPEKEGISRKGLKQRKDGKYRIPNPDTEDLLNTICKMAAKRADVDAAQSLPGVAATLRKLFQGIPSKPIGAAAPKPSPPKGEEKPPAMAEEEHNWKWFWSKVGLLNITPQEAHDILGVASVKNDWLGVQGRTLDEAYEIIRAAAEIPAAPKEPRKEEECQTLPLKLQ